MLDIVKDFRRKQVLREMKNAPREKKIDNIDEVKTIGVICSLDSEQHWNILYHFAKVMENQGKKVSIMALLPKDQEIGFVITHQATYICRTKTDFNFWGIPSGESIREFVDKQYDLLIDTFGEENFFSQYIALRTTASLKVAYATPADDPSEIFDLIIRGEGQLELKDFFNHVIEYLGMIKK